MDLEPDPSFSNPSGDRENKSILINKSANANKLQQSNKSATKKVKILAVEDSLSIPLKQ